MIDNAYFLKDENGSDLPDTDGVKLIIDGVEWRVPNDPTNYMWVHYQAWLAEPNTTITEP